MLVRALCKDIEILGEAAARVGEETRLAMTGVPWDEIVGMRNRLIHAYFDVNLDILWKTVLEDLPPLVSALKSILRYKN